MTDRKEANRLIAEKLLPWCMSAWRPDFFADEPACWRAVDSAKLDWHFEKEGDSFFFVYFDTDNIKVRPASGMTRAEAMATALYEYAKTL